MYRFFETIFVNEGEAKHLCYHNKRLNSTLMECMSVDANIDIGSFIRAPDKRAWRCKVTYGAKVEKIEWFVHVIRLFRSFKLINTNISYKYKFDDRSEIDALFQRRGISDDVILIKNGMVTDTSIANIAIFEKERWITPREPLLRGTTRERLLDEGVIIEGVVTPASLKSTKKIALMNAILGFYEVNNPIFEE